ncbi:hypothetical protein, partial [Deinococcus wulumuqiensis]
MLLGLLILLLLSLNLGGIFSAAMQFGRQEVLAGLGTLLMVGLLDAVGFWLLQGLRGRIIRIHLGCGEIRGSGKVKMPCRARER